jgi:hypothetical protein
VAVFSVDTNLIREINKAAKAGENLDRFKGCSTLKLIQSIPTIPNAFPRKLNTCGRLCLHSSGRFVLVSNRGHQSIAILRVKDSGSKRGQLESVGHFHTRGETPRHFKFDKSGQFLIVANQDTDNLAVFSFNYCSGEIKFTGNEYKVPSPNFICCCPLRDEESQAIPLSDDESSDSSTSSSSTTNKEALEAQLYEALAEVKRLQSQISQV